ncbi:MAG TPA: methyltransferase domain-containing protein [Vicinamibacterales bacterium]|nr:methyltransferase domain-containing protein [Vicinamibacterales bacterium]
MKAIVALLGIAVIGAAPIQQKLHAPDVKYVPTPQNVVEVMLDMAHVTSSDIVYDLGSGDGRIPITAALKYGARGVGVEIDARLVAESNENAKKAGVADRVHFLNADLFETDFSNATVVTMFLLPRLMDRLIPKLKALPPGSRIVSHMWHMGPAWPPEEERDVNSLLVYLWTIH